MSKVFLAIAGAALLLIVLAAVRVSDREDEIEERQNDGRAWEEDDD